MHSRMAVLWAFIGINPVYEMICGVAESLGLSFYFPAGVVNLRCEKLGR